jgi:hypothetical protein
MNKNKNLSKGFLIQKFSEALGVDKAKVMIDAALGEIHLEDKTSFTRDEVLTISKNLQLKGGFIKILANCLAAEAYLNFKDDVL